jgi:hypothetical protein
MESKTALILYSSGTGMNRAGKSADETPQTSSSPSNTAGINALG